MRPLKIFNHLKRYILPFYVGLDLGLEAARSNFLISLLRALPTATGSSRPLLTVDSPVPEETGRTPFRMGRISGDLHRQCEYRIGFWGGYDDHNQGPESSPWTPMRLVHSMRCEEGGVSMANRLNVDAFGV